MDVRLLLKDKCEIDIEMQVMNFRYWTNRVMYYSSRMLSEQLKRGQDYGKFIKCVSISILDFNIFDKNSYPGYYSSYHEKAIMDYKVQNRAAREEGIKEGIKKGKLLTAKNMLNDGLSLEFISRATELPTEKIKELQNEIDEKAN